jgi:hypothetical protein
MATTFKTISTSDVAVTKTLLNEVIPLTGTIVSGTYSDLNIKNYSHGMFQSVYDYPYLSSSANHVFDISLGYAASSGLSGSGSTQNSKKINIYNQMAQILAGHDSTGSINLFDQDGDFASGTKFRECYFVSFARLLVKDEIKKGSFTLTLGTGSYSTPFAGTKSVSDYGASTSFKVNSPAGEYGLLYTSSADAGTASQAVGHIYYQAGIAVLTASVFNSANFSGSSTLSNSITGSTIQQLSDVLRYRTQNIQFNNTTELNSTIYFCRASHNEFNYSSNPTYLSSSKIVVKNSSTDIPVSYITTVGLYSADNELLAVAKLSEPIRKDPTNELTVRVRLDY